MSVTSSASWSFMDAADVGPDFTGHSRNRVIHELGHAYGRDHAVHDILPEDDGKKTGWCGEKATIDNAPDHTPFAFISGFKVRPVLGTLVDGTDREVWGFDTRFVKSGSINLAVSDPREVFDVMSYCTSEVQSSQGR